MDHLAEAKRSANTAVDLSVAEAQLCAQLAIAHALIAIAERLPPPAKPWSAIYTTTTGGETG